MPPPQADGGECCVFPLGAHVPSSRVSKRPVVEGIQQPLEYLPFPNTGAFVAHRITKLTHVWVGLKH